MKLINVNNNRLPFIGDQNNHRNIQSINNVDYELVPQDPDNSIPNIHSGIYITKSMGDNLHQKKKHVESQVIVFFSVYQGTTNRIKISHTTPIILELIFFIKSIDKDIFYIESK